MASNELIDYQKYLKQKKQNKELQKQINYMEAQVQVRNRTIAKLERDLDKQKELEKRLSVLEARNIMLLDVYNSLSEGSVKDSIGNILKIGEQQ